MYGVYCSKPTQIEFIPFGLVWFGLVWMVGNLGAPNRQRYRLYIHSHYNFHSLWLEGRWAASLPVRQVPALMVQVASCIRMQGLLHLFALLLVG
jgi:hypothetical protein